MSLPVACSVADVPDNKMSVLSLAKVYGPTLVGYSTADLEPGALLTETRQQQTVSAGRQASHSGRRDGAHPALSRDSAQMAELGATPPLSGLLISALPGAFVAFGVLFFLCHLFSIFLNFYFVVI